MIFLNAILYLFISYTLYPFCMPSIHPIEPYHLKLVEEYVYAPFKQCNYSLKNPKIVINPYKEQIENLVQPKPFASFCLKCAACISVANEITKTLKTVISDLNENLDFNKEVTNNINLLCTRGFKNFDLRKCNEDILITNKVLCTEHVRSNMDGSWTRKLREMCHLYTSYLDLNSTSYDFVVNLEELPNKLCRSSGIFRDCINIGEETFKNLTSEINLCEQCNCLQ
ncbi:uncharacterized protein LOC130893322 [Diorhabda carinulata]|uniref:uncharacterized protein LOC130893322 n=1 Tax=Diorhabda carinulata TaxID=1163345 RepID=UPI0025A02515|nr:uncharacterized protein LOC130893322 [Diorhabda carinulata]